LADLHVGCPPPEVVDVLDESLGGLLGEDDEARGAILPGTAADFN
jgi:hypothetical protein